MIELTVGTRFYYNGELCEVSSEQCWHCTDCVFNDDLASCRMFVCEQATRHDGRGFKSHPPYTYITYDRLKTW